MIMVRLTGGLGNQMFQYALGRALATKHNQELRLDVSQYQNPKEPRQFWLSGFEIRATRASKVQILLNKLFCTVKEIKPGFSPEILEKSKGYFVGNWQTENYFKEIAKEIRSEFSLKTWGDKAQSIKKTIEADPNSVSLHVRRGDYATDPHLTKKHGILPPTYYANALNKIRETVTNPHVYVFSDDIEWVKKNLELPSSTSYVSTGDESITPQEEMMLMSLCRHHIIANSTYSWWGAWLDPRADKIVIAPTIWYAVGIDSSDLVPPYFLRM